MDQSKPYGNAFIRRVVVDDEGNIKRDIAPAVQVQLTCEHPGCSSTEGRDYKRKRSFFSSWFSPSDWEKEPIFLCKERSKGYKLVRPTEIYDDLKWINPSKDNNGPE